MKDNRLLKSIILTAILLLTIVVLVVCSLNGEGQAVEIPEATEEPATMKETIVYDTWQPNEEEVEALAKVLYGECRGVKSQMEQAAVAWCVLNRVDSRYYPNTVLEVITQRKQFAGWDEDHPVLPTLKAIAEDVLTKWHKEKTGEEDVDRVLPSGYVYFVGDGTHNYFTEEYRGKDYWDFSLENPYEN